MEVLFVTQPMVAQIITVVGRHDNHGVVHPPGFFHPVKEPAQTVVDLFDQPHIGRNDPLPHVIAGKGLAHARVHEGFQHRMRARPPLILRPDRGQHVLGSVHVVVGRGYDVGPVRLDQGEVAEPGPVRVGRFHEFLRPPDHVGRFAVFFGNVGRPVGVLEQPAGQQLALIAQRRIGKVFPGVLGRVALIAQVLLIVGLAPLRPVGVQAVVALKGHKPTLRHTDPDLRLRINAQPLHAFHVSPHMGLAHQHRIDPNGPQVIAQRQLAHAQRHLIVGRTMTAHVAPRIGAHPARPTDGRLDVSVGKPKPPLSDPVDVRCVQMRMAVAGQKVPPQLVRHDPENVHGPTSIVKTGGPSAP